MIFSPLEMWVGDSLFLLSNLILPITFICLCMLKKDSYIHKFQWPQVLVNVSFKIQFRQFDCTIIWPSFSVFRGKYSPLPLHTNTNIMIMIPTLILKERRIQGKLLLNFLLPHEIFYTFIKPLITSAWFHKHIHGATFPQFSFLKHLLSSRSLVLLQSCNFL